MPAGLSSTTALMIMYVQACLGLSFTGSHTVRVCPLPRHSRNTRCGRFVSYCRGHVYWTATHARRGIEHAQKEDMAICCSNACSFIGMVALAVHGIIVIVTAWCTCCTIHTVCTLWFLINSWSVGFTSQCRSRLSDCWHGQVSVFTHMLVLYFGCMLRSCGGTWLIGDSCMVEHSHDNADLAL